MRDFPDFLPLRCLRPGVSAAFFVSFKVPAAVGSLSHTSAQNPSKIMSYVTPLLPFDLFISSKPAGLSANTSRVSVRARTSAGSGFPLNGSCAIGAWLVSDIIKARPLIGSLCCSLCVHVCRMCTYASCAHMQHVYVLLVALLWVCFSAVQWVWMKFLVALQYT